MAPFKNNYHHAVVIPANARIVYVSGQVGLRADGSLPDTLEAQADQAWQNLTACIGETGMGPKNIVKINACKKATNISITDINNANTKDIPVDATGPNASFIVIINAIRLITTKCPAVMFANKRTNKENGLINTNPINSITANTGLNITGTPGIHNVCAQKSLLPLNK